ncbi:MAG: hypothetical protein JSR29_11715 [Nitrospira sp.]|nr:hypothetical protein [Nitrospira sp.]
MIPTENTARPQIIAPMEPQDFSKPITIRWNPVDTEVLSWWLCIGTMQPNEDEGDWNIASEDIGRQTEKTIDLSLLPRLSGIRVQLLSTVVDQSLVPPERTIVLEPIVINGIMSETPCMN